MNIAKIILSCLILISIQSGAEQPESIQEPATKTLLWPDGTRYVGGVIDGKRAGRGTIFWQEGTRFIGYFENDMRNGPGTMILPDGTVYRGYFKDDKLVYTETSIPASDPNEVPQVEKTNRQNGVVLGETIAKTDENADKTQNSELLYQLHPKHIHHRKHSNYFR